MSSQQSVTSVREESGIAPEGLVTERELGALDLGVAGPLVFVTGGIHGNEPAGVHAARRVLEQAQREQIAVRGRVVFLAGNLTGLRQRVRFVDRDLNRLWSSAEIARVRGTEPGQRCVEEREMLQLLACFEREIAAFADRGGQVACLDLHTSSSVGPPFSCMGDTLRNRRVAFALPIPVILGLEETLDGAMLDTFYDRGAIAVAVEGGLHEDPIAIERLEDAIWIALVATGSVERSAAPRYAARVRRLHASASSLPEVIEVRHREALQQRDQFEMRLGFRSFDQVRRGQELATKNGRTLVAGEDSFVLLPLYQGKGSDGYFLGRSVRPFWLRFSAFLRSLNLDDALALLPGVRAHPELKDAFLVNPKVARFFVVQIFHLLGYRRRRVLGRKLLFTRRPEPR